MSDTLTTRERIATDAESLINDEARLPDWQPGVPGKTYPGHAVNPSAGAPVDVIPYTGTLNVGQSNILSWQRRVTHILIQNQTASNVFIDFDKPANPGAILVPPGGLFTIDIPCDDLHVYPVAAMSYNLTTAGNLVIRGWA